MLSNDLNVDIYRLSITEEVKGAIFALSDSTASCPDGFTGLFY